MSSSIRGPQRKSEGRWMARVWYGREDEPSRCYPSIADRIGLKERVLGPWGESGCPGSIACRT